jgi:hypothetical protein
MEHKIVSEYDRVRVEDRFSVEEGRDEDLSSDDAIAAPRFWLPRRALALAALVLMLTTLAAVLWPGSFNAILHQNRDISRIGVPVGVPEASSAPISSNAVASSPVQTNVANQDARPAEPASSRVASVNQVVPSSTELAANNQAAEPEPPTEGPDDSAAAAPDSASAHASVTQDTNAGTDKPSNIVTTESVSAETKTVSKTKPIASTIRPRGAATSRRTRVAQVPSYGSGYGMPPLHLGSFRTRIVGTTPDGRLILALPSGETVVVERPHRRMRHILIERRDRFVPPLQPFDPTFPPVD